METIKEYKETIDLFGKEREVTITIKTEFDPDAISIIESIESKPDIPETISNYENGNLSVDIIWVEVKCGLFSGTDCLGGCFASSIQEHLETVDCHHMVNEAIDDYKADAKRYKDFFEGNK